MKHKGLVIALGLVLLVGGAFLVGFLSLIVFRTSGDGSWFPGGRVGVVTVEGTVLASDDLIKQLERFRKNDGVRSVVLRLESPGGSVGASQEILEAVKKLAAKKPVVASMGAVAASGAYYISCGATRVLANPGTITGSIGVRLEHVMIGDLLGWAKIKHETLKSGPLKDLAAFDRPMTPEERAVLQGMLDDMHRQFKEEVARARALDMARVDELADGRIYTGRQALDAGLIDAIGGMTEAVRLAGTLGGIRGEPKLVYPPTRNQMLERLFESAGNVIGKGRAAMLDYWQPLFMIGAY